MGSLAFAYEDGTNQTTLAFELSSESTPPESPTLVQDLQTARDPFGILVFAYVRKVIKQWRCEWLAVDTDFHETLLSYFDKIRFLFIPDSDEPDDYTLVRLASDIEFEQTGDNRIRVAVTLASFL